MNNVHITAQYIELERTDNGDTDDHFSVYPRNDMKNDMKVKKIFTFL